MSKPSKPVSSKAKLVFFGNERLATAVSTDAPVLRWLVGAGYDVRAVVASRGQAVSRSKRGLEIVEIAHAYHIPVLLPEKLADISGELEELGAEAGILVAYGQIIPQTVIDLFPKGIINIHPSLLPAYRGPTPVETAILDGLEETGVSLMSLTAKMDAGPVYAQAALGINPNETKPQLARQLLKLGVQLLAGHLDDILTGQLEPLPQDTSAATYTRLLTKDDGRITFKAPAELIERKVRALLEFPKTSAEIFGQPVIITKARTAKNQSDGKLVIQCRPGWLEIEELTGPSGRSMSGADFIRGYKK